jgi:hypothetical protein
MRGAQSGDCQSPARLLAALPRTLHAQCPGVCRQAGPACRCRLHRHRFCPGGRRIGPPPMAPECEILAPAEVAKYKAAYRELREQQAEAERQAEAAQAEALRQAAAAQAEAQRQQQIQILWQGLLRTPAGDYAQRYANQTQQEANTAMIMPYIPYLQARERFDANNQEIVRRAQQAKRDLQWLWESYYSRRIDRNSHCFTDIQSSRAHPCHPEWGHNG